VHPDRYKPLVCYPRYNDNGRDTSGAELETDSVSFNLPPGTPAPTKQISLGTSGADSSIAFPPSYLDSVPLNCHATGTTLTPTQQQACIDYCEGNIDDALDLLFNHPNLPVMVSRQLIQRLVTSNPTPGYVQRVAVVFANNGSGVRGDLKATVRAILMDAEARRPLTDPAFDPNFGKTREPLLKLVAMWRHFGAISGDTALIPATNVRDNPPTANPLAGQPSRRRWGPTNPQNEYEMRPLGAPTVFNFYEPDYKQPGEVTEAGLYSPELQIIHEVTSVATSNDLFTRLCSGYGSNNCSAGNTGTTPPADNTAGRPCLLSDGADRPDSLEDRSQPERSRSDGCRGHRADRVLQHPYDGRSHVGNHSGQCQLPQQYRHRHEGLADESCPLCGRFEPVLEWRQWRYDRWDAGRAPTPQGAVPDALDRHFARIRPAALRNDPCLEFTSRSAVTFCVVPPR